jgi:ATP-dependent DNA helicase RecG
VNDWSVAIVEGATHADLDETAIGKAREVFKNKFPDKAAEADEWDDVQFLNKAKITVGGKITRTAILLLGKEESEHFLSPADPKIRWILKDANNIEKDYAIVSCPFLLAVDRIYRKIRNLKYRYIKDGSLFPDEIDQYEPYIIREAINNCIAHQDYARGGRINVVEMENEQLVFTNPGTFIPGSVEKVIRQDAPDEYYRNKFLATAMFNLKMVDTMGGGIKKMFIYQKDRFFPLPEYDLSEERVKVTVTGKILNMDYARLLARTPSLLLHDIILLDKVQKNKELTDAEEKYLKERSFIEGEKPDLHISKKNGDIQELYREPEQNAEYLQNKPLDKQQYFDLILKNIGERRSMTRKDIDALLRNIMPDHLSDEQKKNRIMNLIQELSRIGKITNKGSRFSPEWFLS